MQILLVGVPCMHAYNRLFVHVYDLSPSGATGAYHF